MEKVSLNYFQVTHFLTKLNNDAPLCGSSGAIPGAGGGAGAILGAGEGDLDMKNGDILLIVHNIASLRSLEITLKC